MINDLTFIPLLCAKYRNFKKTDTYKWNFSCPLCGDSHKDPSKARGWIFLYKQTFMFNCFNCGQSLPFSAFLKNQDEELYKKYVFEKFKKTPNSKKQSENKEKAILDELTSKKVKFKTSNVPKSWKKMSSLDDTHEAVKYLKSRKVPLKGLYFTDDFRGMTNSLIKGKFENAFPEQRIILPLLSEDKKLFGFQGRSLKPNDKLRYITIMLDEDEVKIFGQHRVNKYKTVYAVEGPFDSLFLENAIAISGSDLLNVTEKYKDVVLIWDNEPRKKEIISKIEKAIELGHRVVVWPESIKAKDINDMVLEGIDVNSVVKNRVFSGLKAKLELTKWRKV